MHWSTTLSQYYFFALLSLKIIGSKLYCQIIDSHSFAVDIDLPALALIAIEPNSAVVLSITAEENAGKKPNFTAADTSIHWINYSSAITPFGLSRNLTAQIVSGSVPPGIAVQLLAGEYQGNGAGALGISKGQITLNNSPQVIIENIGGAYTNTGPNTGHPLFYSLAITDYASLDHHSTDVLMIVFTLSDN